jgi:methylated-DNA-[protein]-cysteine S-methyltransferase
MTLFYKEMKSPVGKLKLVASSRALVAVLWEKERPNRVKLDEMNLDPRHPILIETERQLSEYFSGKRTQFDLPLQPEGTEFQKKVWRALREIPFGKTKSYLELARTVGSPKASRAVGAANGKNPLSIVVPCHRVVGADGTLTGFAGGLKTKAALLALEAVSRAGDRHGVSKVRASDPVLASDPQAGLVCAQFPPTNGSVHH